MIRLNNPIKRQIRTAFKDYHNSLLYPPVLDEDDFVERTVKAFQKLSKSGDGQSLRTRSVKVHGKPWVCFSPGSSSLPATVRREIGDILFVYKHLSSGRLDSHRGSLVQVKYAGDGHKSWVVETGQFCLMVHWPKFNVIKPARFFKTYDLEPNTLSWATYCFVGPNVTKYPLYFSSNRILRALPFRSVPSTRHFSFSLDLVSVASSIYGAGFLLRFLQGMMGENLFINLNTKILVNDLYKIARLVPDPPGELEWNSEEPEERGNFGIVEFTVTEERESIRRY